jgi:hypothetical protein
MEQAQRLQSVDRLAEAARAERREQAPSAGEIGAPELERLVESMLERAHLGREVPQRLVQSGGGLQREVERHASAWFGGHDIHAPGDRPFTQCRSIADPALRSLHMNEIDQRIVVLLQERARRSFRTSARTLA